MINVKLKTSNSTIHQRPPIGAICSWDTNAPHLCAYKDVTLGVVLGYASAQQRIKRGARDCSKVIMAPLVSTDDNSHSNPWIVQVDNNLGYIDPRVISHIDLHRIQRNHGKYNTNDIPNIRKESIKILRQSFSGIKKHFWVSLMFPDQHSGHRRPVLVVGENISDGTYIAMLDSRHCPDVYDTMNNSYISSNGIYGPQIRYMLPEIITFPQNCGHKPNFDRSLLLPDSEVIQEMKRHILQEQLTFAR